jgi:hypothetical protein
VNHAWTVNLAHHVEPRKVMSGSAKTLALAAIGFLAALGLGFGLFAP